MRLSLQDLGILALDNFGEELLVNTRIELRNGEMDLKLAINGHRMDIKGCSKLRSRVHPYCGHKGGGLLRSSWEDREALRECMSINNVRRRRERRKRRRRILKRNRTNKNKSRIINKRRKLERRKKRPKLGQ